MLRMHLTGSPPNLGAHLLAWEIGLEPERMVPFETRHPGMIDRLLAGEIVPGTDIAAELSQLSGGRVPVGAWRRLSWGSWGRPPAPWAGAWVEGELMRRQLQKKAA